jgi:Holliday junction DNA helicase RuvB
MGITVKQTFSLLWHKAFRDNNTCRFEEIVSHDDIKQIFVKAMDSKRPVHLLLVGSPGSAKSMFLTEIMRHNKTSYFVVGSNTTKAGLVNQLFERRPKFLLIDELEKMNNTDQTSLLHLMEAGIISETKINKTRQTELTSWVFATANSCKKIIEPLLSRFLVLEIPEYTFDEFREIAVSRLAKENVDKYIASVIAENVWNELESRDIRDVVKVARLTKTVEDIPFMIRMMKRRQ